MRTEVKMNNLNQQQKKQLLRFLAALSWADSKVKQKEIDLVLALRKELDIEETFEDELRNIFIKKYNKNDIFVEYNKLENLFPNDEDKKKELITKYIFKLFSSDNEISNEEGTLFEILNNVSQEADKAKILIFDKAAKEKINAIS